MALGLAALLLPLAGGVLRAADGDEFVGTWQVSHDGYNEVWNIKMDKGDWSVGGAFFQKGKEVGSWKGADVKFADGKLSCTQKWVKKPDPTWGDATQLTAAVSGDKLTFVWDNGGGNSGTRDMARVKSAGGEGAELVGAWGCDHDGLHEAWNIVKSDKGEWGVEGAFFKKGQIVGAWRGGDVKYSDGKLTCTQNYLKKPVASWSDSVKLTASVAGDKLNFMWDAGGGNTGTREMSKEK
jgi:hypothetical protein